MTELRAQQTSSSLPCSTSQQVTHSHVFGQLLEQIPSKRPARSAEEEIISIPDDLSQAPWVVQEICWALDERVVGVVVEIELTTPPLLLLLPLPFHPSPFPLPHPPSSSFSLSGPLRLTRSLLLVTVQSIFTEARDPKRIRQVDEEERRGARGWGLMCVEGEGGHSREGSPLLEKLLDARAVSAA